MTDDDDDDVTCE